MISQEMLQSSTMSHTEQELDRIFRDSYGRVLANLIARFEDFDLAEEALSEALVAAVEKWDENGIPENPGGWLTVTARRIAIDRLRRETNYRDKLSMLEHDPDLSGYSPVPDMAGTYPDERLKLIFTCCHPALAMEAQVALTLRTLGGLTTAEIADAFLIKKSAMSQRLVRAKRKIKDAGIPYRVPPASLLTQRLNGVLAVIYLIYNEGYFASSGERLIREDLIHEAIRLGKTLITLLEREGLESYLPETLGLQALMLLHHARSPARVGPHGELVTLEGQDRSLWDQTLVLSGLDLLDQALKKDRPGPYQIQAAISALHAEATTSEETDWTQIALLYQSLYEHNLSPIVRLNQVVAISMAEGHEAAWEMLEPLDTSGTLDHYPPFHIVRADLLRQRGKLTAAAGAYRQAATLTENEVERRHLLSQARNVERQLDE